VNESSHSVPAALPVAESSLEVIVDEGAEFDAWSYGSLSTEYGSSETGEVWYYSSLDEGELGEPELDEVWSDETECASGTPAHFSEPLFCQITASPVDPSSSFFQDLFVSEDGIDCELNLLKYYGLDGVDKVIEETVGEFVEEGLSGLKMGQCRKQRRPGFLLSGVLSVRMGSSGCHWGDDV